MATVGVALIVVATAYIAAVRDDFEAALFAIAAAGLLLAALQAFPRRPQLELSFVHDGTPTDTLLVGADVSVRPLDVEAIIRHEVAQAHATAPARPRRMAFGHAFMASALAPSEEDYAKFDAEVGTYVRELRAWLQEKDARRCDALHELSAHIRLLNSGEHQATNSRIRLLFPPGWQELTDDDDLDPYPPERPEWRHPFFGSPLHVPRLSPIPHIELPRPSKGGLRGPRVYQDGPHLVAEYTSQHLSADLAEQSGYPVDLQPPGPGVYDVAYEVYADVLRSPQRGILRVDVRPIREVAPPITRLDEPGELVDD